MKKPSTRAHLIASGFFLAVTIGVPVACWQAVFAPQTTTIRGSSVSAFFHCIGSAASNRFWLSGSRWTYEEDEQRHYVFTTYERALARMRGDTLDVYHLGLQVPPDPDLDIPVRSIRLDGVEFRKLSARAEQENLTLVGC